MNKIIAPEDVRRGDDITNTRQARLDYWKKDRIGKEREDNPILAEVDEALALKQEGRLKENGYPVENATLERHKRQLLEELVPGFDVSQIERAMGKLDLEHINKMHEGLAKLDVPTVLLGPPFAVATIMAADIAFISVLKKFGVNDSDPILSSQYSPRSIVPVASVFATAIGLSSLLYAKLHKSAENKTLNKVNADLDAFFKSEGVDTSNFPSN